MAWRQQARDGPGKRSWGSPSSQILETTMCSKFASHGPSALHVPPPHTAQSSEPQLLRLTPIPESQASLRNLLLGTSCEDRGYRGSWIQLGWVSAALGVGKGCVHCDMGLIRGGELRSVPGSVGAGKLPFAFPVPPPPTASQQRHSG